MFKKREDKIAADPKMRAERQTLEIIDLHKKGIYSNKHIAEQVGVSEEIVHNRVAAYMSHGKISPPEQGAKTKFTQEHKAFVIDHLKSLDGKVTGADIQEEFQKAYADEGLTVSVPTICTWISQAGIKYTLLKHSRETMTPEQRQTMLDARKMAARTLVQLLRDPGILTVIFDEVTFSQFDHSKWAYDYEGRDLADGYTGAINSK